MSGRCDELLDRVRELDEHGEELEFWADWLEGEFDQRASGPSVWLKASMVEDLAKDLREAAAFLFAKADQFAREARQ